MKIGFIGAGNMAGAIIRGMVGGGFRGSDILIYDTDSAKMVALFEECGVSICSSGAEVAGLADAVVLVATAPKSNSAHDGINAAIADIQAGRTGPIPRHLQNKHYDGADAKVKGQHYLYPHDYPNHWTAQQYLPDAIKNRQYYVPGDNKNEQAFAQYWKKIKGEL